MSDVEKYLEALRQRATLQPESGSTGSVVSEAIICPTCKTPLNEQHQIGAGDRAAVMANLGIMEVKLRCPGCDTVFDVTLPRGHEWKASVDIPGWGTFPVHDSTPDPPSGGVPAAWYADPMGRHQYRYWDGASWTHHVANDGQASIDPLDQQPDEGRGTSAAAELRQASLPDMAGSEPQSADSTKTEVRGLDAPVPTPELPQSSDPVERLIAELRAKKNNRADARPVVDELASLCDSRSVPILLEVAAHGPGVDSTHSELPGAAEKALQGMGQSAPRQVIPVLQSALSDPSAAGRPVAAKLLSQLEPESGNDLLVHLLEDRDSRLVAEAARALGKRRCKEAVPALEGVLVRRPPDGDDWFDKAEWPRKTAAEALGQIGDAGAVPHLLNLLSWENDILMVNAAIDALGAIRSPQAFDPLLQFAVDHPQSRFTAAVSLKGAFVAALVATAGPGATERLAALLGDAGTVDGRALAVGCLREVGGEAAALPLLHLTQRLSQQAAARAGSAPLGNAVDPIEERKGVLVHDPGPVLKTLHGILERDVAAMPDATLRAIADMGPIVASVYFMSAGDDDGDTKCCPLDTHRITELARSELDRRESR